MTVLKLRQPTGRRYCQFAALNTCDQTSLNTEYQSLFENAICGIYRDRLDGTPVRANLALALMNGYASETEYIKAVSTPHSGWYVDPARGQEFTALLERDGRVNDFVSQVYSHRTREPMWITENAWYVRDLNGNPLFIEGTIQDASERMSRLSLMERLANVDSVTQVASRHRFICELEAYRNDPERSCTLFCIDLDRFKDVNDIFGHSAGDAVLRTVAERLVAIAGNEALVARSGGDEFLVLHHGALGQAEIQDTVQRMLASLSQSIAVRELNIFIGASIGVASYPDQSTDSDQLLCNADLALYQAKASGRGQFRIFDNELRQAIDTRSEIERDLRIALAENQFELAYQPIHSSKRNCIEGYEALIRWRHPRKGLLPPSEFLAVAEDMGLTEDIGTFVLNRACEQFSCLPDNLSIAVNVSPLQFRSTKMIESLTAALTRSGLSPKRLILEITESAILSSESVITKVFQDVRDLGVGLALDDFGTGFSSLSHLQRFDFDIVKIDRSFVSSMLNSKRNLAIVHGILSMCRDLGIKVIAEGIEHLWQIKTLKADGCDLMQGYHFGRPTSFADIVSDIGAQSLERYISPVGAAAQRRSISDRGATKNADPAELCRLAASSIA